MTAETGVAADPLHLFQTWFEEAVAAGEDRPDAMTLATCTPDGWPSARTVLFKGLQDGAFTFFTNYQSRKGRELEENPRAALVFYWEKLHRAVRIEGTVEQCSSAASDDYWFSRPRESRLSALASSQSQPISNRATLEQEVSRLRAAFADQEIPRPPHWGGFLVLPVRMEFWRGRRDRLHDRQCYLREEAGWRLELLAP